MLTQISAIRKRVARFALFVALCISTEALSQPVTPLPPPAPPVPPVTLVPPPPATAPPRPPVPVPPTLLVPLILLWPSEVSRDPCEESGAACGPSRKSRPLRVDGAVNAGPRPQDNEPRPHPLDDEPHLLDGGLQANIEKVLNECDKIAAAKVIAKYFDSRTATEKECKEIVGADEEGKPLSRERAMGNEHDKLAQRCAEERLRLLKPGGFSIKPTYRRNPETGQVEYLPDSLVNNLLRDFKGGQLLGSIEPDVVVHVRNAPYSIQAVYDFKLPCVSGRTRRWSTYESGPHKGKSQGGVYKELLKVVPIIIGF